VALSTQATAVCCQRVPLENKPKLPPDPTISSARIWYLVLKLSAKQQLPELHITRPNCMSTARKRVKKPKFATGETDTSETTKEKETRSWKEKSDDSTH
jgi:hypothetical protein